MCNDYGIDIPFRLFVEAFSELRIPLDLSRGIPNLQPRDEIWPTERAPIVRWDGAAASIDNIRWGLKPHAPKRPPVINMRGEGRAFSRGRCLIPASHYFEFSGAKSPKTRWRFNKSGEDWFCIAGVLGDGDDGGRPVDAFTMLTVPDVAPIHDRQVCVLERRDWRGWLDGALEAREVLTPSPAGTFVVAKSTRA